jgi:hypothetical protein
MRRALRCSSTPDSPEGSHMTYSFTSYAKAANNPRSLPSRKPSVPSTATQTAKLRTWLVSFLSAVKDFIVGDSGVDTGWPCLRCSSVSHHVRDFIANGGGVDGWRIKIMHGGGLVGVIAERFGIDPDSIVIHSERAICPRLREGECDICLSTVLLDPISDGCPVNTSHFVSSKRLRLQSAPAPSASSMTDS